VEALGAVAIILGYKTRWGAAGLAAFLVAATWIFHTGPDQRIQLLKNLAILGGLFNLIAQGPGGISLEGGGKA
jgi:putative oxidoreductase